MSELSDRVDTIKKQQAERAREKHEIAIGPPIRKPTEEEAPVIHEFLQSYEGPWHGENVWTTDGADRLCCWSPCYVGEGDVHEEDCIQLPDDIDGYRLYVLRDGRVCGRLSHRDLVEHLAELLAM